MLSFSNVYLSDPSPCLSNSITFPLRPERACSHTVYEEPASLGRSSAPVWGWRSLRFLIHHRNPFSPAVFSFPAPFHRPLLFITTTSLFRLSFPCVFLAAFWIPGGSYSCLFCFCAPYPARFCAPRFSLLSSAWHPFHVMACCLWKVGFFSHLPHADLGASIPLCSATGGVWHVDPDFSLS